MLKYTSASSVCMNKWVHDANGRAMGIGRRPLKIGMHKRVHGHNRSLDKTSALEARECEKRELTDDGIQVMRRWIDGCCGRGGCRRRVFCDGSCE